MKIMIIETEYYFAITLKESGKVIGEIDAYPETGEPHADENSVRDTFSPCWMLNGIKMLFEIWVGTYRQSGQIILGGMYYV